ncbi:hypothetical protein ACROYT_G027667 [Oculina patagonica]
MSVVYGTCDSAFESTAQKIARVSTVKDGHQAEVDGMKKQIGNMTAELHKRDVAIASITERTQRMEKDLREASAKHDRARSC